MGTKMRKCVNGVMVDMTDVEIATRQAEEQKYLDKVAAYNATEKYKEDREAAYPPIGVQLDALLKQFEAMKIAGVSIDMDLQSIIDQWNAVKIQYPKPQV